MKLATFQAPDGSARIAAIDADRQLALDLAAAAGELDMGKRPEFTSMLALIETGREGLSLAREVEAAWPKKASHELSAIQLLAPLPEPRSLRDCLVFEEHLLAGIRIAAERNGVVPGSPSSLWYEQPAYYKCNRMSVIGTDRDVIWPYFAEELDYELELACVIGKKGIDIPRESALEHIFGLTIYNDISARDVQLRERVLGMGPSKGKDFDTGNVLGPWITTLDEIGDPHTLKMSARLNGEQQGGGNSSEMHHKFEDIVSWISRSETLYPGEVIATGTVGTGCGIEQGRLLKDGDVIELEIEKIGVLRNRIVRR